MRKMESQFKHPLVADLKEKNDFQFQLCQQRQLFKHLQALITACYIVLIKSSNRMYQCCFFVSCKSSTLNITTVYMKNGEFPFKYYKLAILANGMTSFLLLERSSPFCCWRGPLDPQYIREHTGMLSTNLKDKGFFTFLITENLAMGGSWFTFEI